MTDGEATKGASHTYSQSFIACHLHCIPNTKLVHTMKWTSSHPEEAGQVAQPLGARKGSQQN